MALVLQPPLSLRKLQPLFHFLDSVTAEFERLTVRMLNGILAISKLSPALALITIYALCTGAGFILWIAMCCLDLTAGTHILEAAINVTEGLNEHVLPGLQLLNVVLALLVGFFILVGRFHIYINVHSNLSRPNPNNISTVSCRSKMIAALPKSKYGYLRRSDDANCNDLSPSSCAICLGCIREEDEIRILPSCKHYFHISCIDRWLLPCTVNNSSCPLCRVTVIKCGLHI